MHAPLIQLKGLTKRFGGVTALDGVSFDIQRGEVHAVVGENGAGKSTLMKLLAGVHAPDAGRLLLRGEAVRLRSPLDARRRGISIVYQELNLLPHRSVTANLFINRERCGLFGLLRHRQMRHAARAALDAVRVNVDPGTTLGRLSLGEKQLVEIARALDQRADVVILDEPNSALSDEESQTLFQIVRWLRQEGVTFIYVSHRLEEVFAIADRITVIRDGRYQGTSRVGETSIPEIIRKMIGRQSIDPAAERETASLQASVAVRVRHLTGRGGLGPVSFDVRAGEILGFAGLEGAGVEKLFHTLFGLSPPRGGRILLYDVPQRALSPGHAMRQGWALVPASRREQGLLMGWTIRRNIVLLVLRQMRSALGLLRRRRMRDVAAKFVRDLNIVTDGLEKKVVHLSGGNQQKVLLAKWLATRPRVLILNDPTRGVDVGAKAEIYKLCRALAEAGMPLLISSSELDETLALSDRILVFHRGRILKGVARGEVAKPELMHWIAGGTGLSPGASASDRIDPPGPG